MSRFLPVAAVLTISFVMAQSVLSQDIRQGFCPTSSDNSFRGLSLGTMGGGYDGFSTFSSAQNSLSVPQYFPVMLNATSLGFGAVGDIPVYKNYIVRASVMNLNAYNVTAPFYQSIIIPIEFGIRVPLLNSKLGTLSYTLYGETSAGLLLGWGFPTNGGFLSNSISNSRFASGASAYLGLGNSLRIGKYLGMYLNGGAQYFNMFSSSFLTRSSLLVPSIAVGFYFNIAG